MRKCTDCGEEELFMLCDDDSDDTLFLMKYTDDHNRECYQLKMRDGNWNFSEQRLLLHQLWIVHKNLTRFMATIPADPYPEDDCDDI